MFDTLMDSKQAAPVDGASRLRGTLSSSGSLFLHAAILLSLAAGFYLQVEPIAGLSRKINPRDIILCSGLPPAGPPAQKAAAASGATTARNDRPPNTTREEIPEVVQPQEIPRELPEAEAGHGSDGADAGSPDGVRGGASDGIPGGSPFGVRDGVPGGDPWGVPGGALKGLPDPDQPVYLVGDVRPPVRTTFVKPEYPETARKARVPGTVILEVVVGRTGDVEEVKVLRSDPLFDQAAIDAVRRWKYQPALQAGRPVKVYLTVRVEFGLV